MDRLDKIEQILKSVAESHAESDRQRAKDKAESDRQRAKDKAESDRQRAEDKAESDRKRAEDKAEFDRQRAKDKAIADERAAEADKRAVEADKRAAEADKRAAKADEERAELRAMLKRNDIRISHMDNRFGDLSEAMLVGDVAETLQTIDNLKLEHSFYNSHGLKGGCEVDALLVGQDSIVVMEAKATLTVNKIERFVEDRLNRFTELFPYFADKKVYGAVGYLKAMGDAVEFAMGEGLLVVRSSLQAKEIINPQDFQPKDYNPQHL